MPAIRKLIFFLGYVLILFYLMDKNDKPSQSSQVYLFEFATLVAIIYVTVNYYYFEIKDRTNKRITIGIIGAIVLMFLATLFLIRQNNLVDKIVFAALIVSLIITAAQSILYLRRRKIESAR